MNQKRILIVEDETVLSNVYQMVLGMNGYDVQTAGNGVLGMTALPSFKPDLILLDLLMPQMDGITFLKNFDAEQYPDVTILVYSNLFDNDTRTEVLELGAKDIILKSSMSPQGLVDLVGHHLGT